MARIISLTVRNFRGIKDLSIDFSDENLICFIGRGDSGKTSILDAISSVLSSSWNLTFYDTDFYNCVLDEPIEITASLIDFPHKLLSEQKYGLHIRSLNTDTNVVNDEMPVDELVDVIRPVLTIKLSVDRSLEPKWIVTNSREQEDKQINATDRASLSCYMVSDYIDRHFSWNKGSPLNSLLKRQDTQDVASENNTIIDSLRQAKTEIDDFPFTELKEVTNLIKNKAAVFGLDISDTHTTLDIKELATKKGQISLHENTIPFRLKGKGSKRLASFAIQSALGDSGGIMLVDEIEQGLEPDRIKQLVRTLKEQQPSQIFLTTHSREVVTELNSSSLLLILKENNGSKIEARRLSTNSDRLQKAVRACPEAFFAKKVIVCEGATEIGICRALDKWRISQGKEQMSFKDCAYVDGTGNTLVERAQEMQQVGISTVLFCDSDDPKVNAVKVSLRESGVGIFDCELDKCIEQQAFADLPWVGVKDLINYALKTHYHNEENSLIDSVKSKYSSTSSFPLDALQSETTAIRDALALASITSKKRTQNTEKRDEWFKSIHHGEILGDIVFKHLNNMSEHSRLRKSLEKLSDWIDS
jgi:putative ATP-dependent endonuclease of OLD family